MTIAQGTKIYTLSIYTHTHTVIILHFNTHMVPGTKQTHFIHANNDLTTRFLLVDFGCKVY